MLKWSFLGYEQRDLDAGICQSDHDPLKSIFFAAEDGKALYSQQKQGLELTVLQIISSLYQNSGLKLKKVGKTTRQVKYDLNQTPYEYTVELTNRFKGLDLVNRVPEELWSEVRNIVQEAANKTIPKKRKARRQGGYLRRTYK